MSIMLFKIELGGGGGGADGPDGEVEMPARGVSRGPGAANWDGWPRWEAVNTDNGTRGGEDGTGGKARE